MNKKEKIHYMSRYTKQTLENIDIQYDRKISKRGMNENSYNIIKVNNYYTLTGKTGLIAKKFETRTIFSLSKMFL